LQPIDVNGLPSASQPVSADWPDVRRWRKSRREVLIASRLALTAVERTAHATAVERSLQDVLGRDFGGVLGFYWPFKGEYDPRPFVRKLQGSGARLALPVVLEKACPLVFRAWWPRAPMVRGVWDIPVPASGEVLVPDTLLVPLVGFDEHGFRLGYGGGYYDRTLASLSPRPRTIAIGHALSGMPTIYPQPHDIPMDVIITETGTRHVRR
jgi:5-formyltetrahydrofolate cyclo-ligase